MCRIWIFSNLFTMRFLRKWVFCSRNCYEFILWLKCFDIGLIFLFWNVCYNEGFCIMQKNYFIAERISTFDHSELIPFRYSWMIYLENYLDILNRTVSVFSSYNNSILWKVCINNSKNITRWKESTTTTVFHLKHCAS